MYTQSQKTGMSNNAKVFRSMKTKEFKEDIQHWLRLLIPDRQELLFLLSKFRSYLQIILSVSVINMMYHHSLMRVFPSILVFCP